MTFAAMAAWQAWLLVGGAAAAAWVLFRIRIRPPSAGIPSVIFWRRVLDASPDHARREALRRMLSLAATMLIAAALAIAVARPSSQNVTIAGSRLLLVLDSSWSMLAKTSGGATRWDAAVSGAKGLLHAAENTEVAIATTFDGLVAGPTADSASLVAVLDRLAPAGPDRAAWPAVAGTTAVHFFTDGAVARPPVPGVITHSVFRAVPNVAITAFRARTATSPAAPAEAYLEFANYGPAQAVHLTVTREAVVLVDRDIEMRAGALWQERISLTDAAGARLQAHVSAPNDAQAIDDDAVAWLASASPTTVTVVTTRPADWMRLLAGDPTIRAKAIRPSDFGATSGDALIFDRWAPEAAPDRPSLLVSPPVTPWLGTRSADERAPRWASSLDHPVLRGLNPLTLSIERAHGYQGPDLQPIATSAKGTALISAAETPARRLVVTGFSSDGSNLLASPAFPVLVGNALEWLTRPIDAEPVAPGTIELPATTTRIVDANGRVVPLERLGKGVVASLRAPGFYRVDTGGSHSVITVNVGSRSLANLQQTTLAASGLPPAGGGQHPWWLYATSVAFALVTVEWFTWQRRVSV